MVEPTANPPQVTEMGQASSQPGSPRLSQEPEVDESRSRKGKKSKSKKTSQDEGIPDAVAERAALEEESARALMQLSSSTLHHDNRAPYYNREGDLQPSAEVAERVHPDGIEGESSQKKRKKKNKKRKDTDRKRRSEAEDALSSKSPTQHFSASPRTHPLDQEASENELVQEYEAEVSHDQLPHVYHFPQQAPNNLDNQGGQETSRNPDQLPPNDQTSSNEKETATQQGPSKKRKRHTARIDVDNLQGDGLPIDPKLHTIGALTPSINFDSLDESGTDFLLATQPQIHRKRRRVVRGQDTAAEGHGYGNAYNVDDIRSDLGDQATQGLGVERSQLSGELDGPCIEDADMGALQRQTNSNRKRSTKSDGATSGGKYGFNADEITMLDNFRHQYCRANDMPLPAFNHFIQSNIRANEQVVSIFNAIQDLFPERSRSSVQRFCRRRYHNFHARGVWTPEEDAELKAAVALKGTSWKVIGEELGRFSEDCRDRYRNYLAPSAEHRNKDAWTETEVINLSHSILECMQRMKHERQRKKGESAGHPVPISDSDSDQEAEDLKLINWQTVSDLMGSYGTARSRIQCSFKWGKIKEADRGRYLKEIKEAKRNLRNLESGNYTANNMKNSTGWRLKAASKQVQNMKSGDKYDLLNAILNSAASKEENIPWRLIGDDAFRQRWSFSERKAGWFMMKKEVEGSEHMDYRQVVHQLLAGLLANGVTERWNIDVHGLVDGSPVKRPRQSKNKGKIVTTGTTQSHANPGENEPQQAGAMSNEYVYDSEENGNNLEAAPSTNRADGGNDRGAESPNSLFDDERSPTYQATSDPPLDESTSEAQHPASGEISPELASQIQTQLLQAV